MHSCLEFCGTSYPRCAGQQHPGPAAFGDIYLGRSSRRLPGRSKIAGVDTHQHSGLASARRIAIVGCIGAGKSTLARNLGALLHLEVFHLDRMWWQDGGYRIVGKRPLMRTQWTPRHSDGSKRDWCPKTGGSSTVDVPI
jgi:hypothetical protein